MSISSGDQFDLFAAFLDVIKNPDKYAQVIQDYKANADIYQKAVDDLTKGQSIDAWADSVRADLVFTQNQLQKDKDDLDKKQAAYLNDVTSREQTLSNRVADVQLKENAIRVAQKNIVDTQTDLATQAASLAEKEANLNKYNDILSAKELDLNTKTDQLQKILST